MTFWLQDGARISGASPAHTIANSKIGEKLLRGSAAYNFEDCYNVSHYFHRNCKKSVFKF